MVTPCSVGSGAAYLSPRHRPQRRCTHHLCHASAGDAEQLFGRGKSPVCSQRVGPLAEAGPSETPARFAPLVKLSLLLERVQGRVRLAHRGHVANLASTVPPTQR